MRNGTLTGVIIYILIVGSSALRSGYDNMTQMVTNASPSRGGQGDEVREIININEGMGF